MDDLDGTVHRAYGLLPNMSWVLDRGGIVLYKAMWTSADRIESFLERSSAAPVGPGRATFYTEQLEVRRRDDAAFRRGLERNGPRAVAEFARAAKIWAERGRRR